MAIKIKASDLTHVRARGGLRRPLHSTIRYSPLEYEYIARKCEGKVIAQETRLLWFRNGWEKELEKLRIKQHNRGLRDVDFMHPSQRAALYKQQNKNGR